MSDAKFATQSNAMCHSWIAANVSIPEGFGSSARFLKCPSFRSRAFVPCASAQNAPVRVRTSMIRQWADSLGTESAAKESFPLDPLGRTDQFTPLFRVDNGLGGGKEPQRSQVLDQIDPPGFDGTHGTPHIARPIAMRRGGNSGLLGICRYLLPLQRGIAKWEPLMSKTKHANI